MGHPLSQTPAAVLGTRAPCAGDDCADQLGAPGGPARPRQGAPRVFLLRRGVSTHHASTNALRLVLPRGATHG